MMITCLEIPSNFIVSRGSFGSPKALRSRKSVRQHIG